jgi:copper chaperone CopZ
MAKVDNGTTFEHCIINLENMEIQEYVKVKGEYVLDETHDITKILEKFNGIDDLKISFKKNTKGIQFK